ncbi:MAG: DUF3017 domain-containing protein [Micrococcales bacterium]|nr:DUF3017 domain-containing protein [Micrococcales bacterium]
MVARLVGAKSTDLAQTEPREAQDEVTVMGDLEVNLLDRPTDAPSQTSMVWVVLAITAATALGALTTARVGAVALAVLLATSAVVRAVRPEPGPVAISVRSRRFDVATQGLLATVLGVLALVMPS